MYIKKKGMMDVVNVLIADDNIHYARFLMNNINKNNKSIRVCYIAKDGKETINVINNLKNIDVILLDLQMPIYNGIEVIEKINDKDRYKKSCIVISGDIDLVCNKRWVHIEKNDKNCFERFKNICITKNISFYSLNY